MVFDEEINGTENLIDKVSAQCRIIITRAFIVFHCHLQLLLEREREGGGREGGKICLFCFPFSMDVVVL